MAAYFFIAQGLNVVKIGHTAEIGPRLASLASWSPVPLILGAADNRGDALTEAELHWRFRHLRQRGEWFLAARELMNVIEASEGGSIPGAWYAPSWLPKNSIRGMLQSDLQNRFGITLPVLAEITGTLWSFVNAPYLGVTVKHIPAIYEWLTTRGHIIEPSDLFPQACRAAA